MLVSLHLPKTAGSSFRTSLCEHYKNNILLDYADKPINTPVLQRKYHATKQSYINGCIGAPDFSCVHGHFLPLKYRFVKKGVFITWLRDPVERIASHYYYWFRNYRPGMSSSLHERVVNEDWSLERFCLSKELRNLYSQFLWGFPVDKFDFIGITEYYDLEMEWFSSRFLGVSLPVYNVNKNDEGVKRGYFSEMPELKQAVEVFHDRDVLLYKKALTLRESRVSGNFI